MLIILLECSMLSSLIYKKKPKKIKTVITGFYYLSIQNETKIIICSIGASIVGNKLILFFQLDLALKDENGGDISSFIMNGEWELIGKIMV